MATALYGTIVGRYKLRGRFISEPVHMVEISPFAMMAQHDGKEHLIDYVLAQEIPDQIDLSEARVAINGALRERAGTNADDAYELIITSLPYVKGAGIVWFSWLDDDVVSQLLADAKEQFDLK